jgi:molybdopterin molybdotransferase
MSAPRRLAEAIAEITAAGTPRPVERVPLLEALGRVVAAPMEVPRAMPPWANAGMDGYAVRGTDVAHARPDAPVALPVTATVPAGTMPPTPLAPGTAMRIFTGAPLPEGADTVVRWEDTDRGATTVRMTSARDAFRNVRPAGEDAAAGDDALPVGTRLGPGGLQWLASLGMHTVPVARRPVVALLRSGDELVPLARAHEVTGARIVDSNAVVLAAVVREAGGVVHDAGICADDEDAFARAVALAAEAADVVVTAGGVAAGDYDVTKGAVVAAGGTLAFWKVAARPGSQVAFGTVGGVPWLGLPGNPVSAAVCGELMLRPLLRAMAGDPRPHRPTVLVTTADRLPRDPRMTLVLRTRLTDDAPGRWRATLAGGQGSHLVRPLALADALLGMAPGEGPLAAGATVPAVRLHDGEGSARIPFADAVA